MSRTIDALVAEHVMGLQPCTDPVGRCEAAHMTPPQCWGNGKGGSDLESYTETIAAAWQVVEKMRLAVIPDAGGGWCAAQEPWDGTGWYEKGVGDWDWGETAPLAICTAALRALGVEVPTE